MGTATETSMNERKVLPLSQPLLDLFWELAELNQEKQIEASVKLIRSLQQSKSDTGDASSDQSLQKSLDYALSRLVRGLASIRGGVRWGYGTALTMLLQEFPSVKTSKVLFETEEGLKINAPADYRTAGVGQLFVYMALVSSGRIPNVSAAHIRSMVQNLLLLEKEKSYLKSGGTQILTHLVEKAPSEIFESSILPLMKGDLGKPLGEMNLDELFFLLRAFQFHKNAVGKLLKQTTASADLLDSANIDAIIKLLFRTPNIPLHPAVLAFAEAFQAMPDRFSVFWTRLVEKAAGEAPWKQKIPLDLVSMLLKFTTDPQQITMLLTKSFLMLLLRNANEAKAAESESLSALHQSATTGMSDISTALKLMKDQTNLKEMADTAVDPWFIENPLKGWSSFLNSFHHKLDLRNIASITDQLVGYLEDSPEKCANQLQMIRLIARILHDRITTVESVGGFQRALRFLSYAAFSMPTDTEARKALSGSASKELINLVVGTHHPPHQKYPSKNAAEELEKEVLVKIAILEVLVYGTEDHAAITEDGSSQELRETAIQIAKRSARLPVNASIKRVIELIALFTAGIWISYKPLLAKEIVEEMVKIEKHLKKKGKKMSDEAVVTYLMNFIMSMLTVERNVFGTFELIFKSLCPFIGMDGLQILLDVMAPDPEEEEAEGVEFVSSDEEEEDDEEMSDVEELLDDPEELAIDRTALRQVPGVSRDDDEDAESEPEMEDDAMFQLDAVLSNILRARKSHKSKEEIDPRFRAARLINIYASYREASPLIILKIIEPLMGIINEKSPPTMRKQHSVLVHTCTKTLLALRRLKAPLDTEDVRNGVSKELVVAMLENAITEAGKVHNPQVHDGFCEGVYFLHGVFIATAVKEKETSSLRKFHIPLIQKFASKRGSAFAHVLMNGLLKGLQERVCGLLPTLFEVITCWDQKKYLAHRQAQLIVILQNLLRELKKINLGGDDIERCMRMFGTNFLRILQEFTGKEGKERKGKKLFGHLVEFAKFLMGWYIKQRRVDQSVSPLDTIWAVKEMKSVAETLKEKLTEKDVKVVRKSVQRFLLALGEVIKKEGGQEVVMENGRAESSESGEEESD